MTNTDLQRATFTIDRAKCSLNDRTITGTIVLFDRATSDGRKFAAGSITPRMPLRNVKLLTEHDENRPVGYMTDYVDHGTRADATFNVADSPEGDQALLDIRNGTRDGFSVGALASDYVMGDGELLYKRAELVEVSLVSVPAFNETRTSSTPTAEEAPPMTDDAQRDPSREATPEPAAATAAAQLPAAAPAAPAAPAQLAATDAPAATVVSRGLSLGGAIKTVTAAFNTGNPAAVQAALADIVPSVADPDGVILRGEWLGELFTAAKTGRPWIDSFGQVQQLTSLKGKGYRWTKKPKPGKYAGEKAEVPTDDVATEEVEFTAERWAGGWDIDRVFVDFADGGFLEAFWRAAVEEYNKDSDADIAAKVIAGAQVVGGSAHLIDGLRRTSKQLRSIGATASRIVLGEELFDEWSNLSVADVPHWLANAVGGVNLATGTATIGQTTVEADPLVPARTIVAYDKRAATVREKSPIQVKAFDVAHAGIDLGFYSYGRLDIHDPRAIVKAAVASAPAEG